MPITINNGIKLVLSEKRQIQIPEVNADIELDFFGEVLPARTFFSRAVFSYDVPEIENLEAKFIYNYFTPDERARANLSPDEQLINIDASNTSDIMYRIQNDNIPRYVKFSFTPARDPWAKLADNITTIVRDNLDKIIVEGAGSSRYHTGVELLDTNLEKTIYKMLSGSFTFINSVSNKDSPLSAAAKLESEIRDKGGLTGESKKLILESMSTMQPEGISFAKSDVPHEIAATSNDPLTKQTFSLKINNLFIGDIFDSAMRIPDKVFQDEIGALAPIGRSIQSEVLESINPSKVTEADFQNAVNAISMRPVDKSKDMDLLSKKHN